MTAPWPAEVAELVTGPHGTTCRVLAHLPGGDVDLDTTDLRIGWDEARAPRCTATIACPLPGDSLLTALDPRLIVRVSVLLGYVLADGSTAERTVATLDLRSVTEDQPTGTMTLRCAGVEARVMDHALAWLAVDTSARTFVVEAVSAPGVPITLDPAVADVIEPYDTTTDLTTNLWIQVDDFVDVLEADLFDPGDGVLRLTRRPAQASQSVHVLRTGPGGTLTRTASARSRQAWHNSVTLHYLDDTGAYVRTGTADAAGPFAPGTVGYVSFVEERTGRPTQVAANRAAQAVLARMLSGGRSYDAEAIAAWWVRPGDTVTVETGRDAQERHLVARVELSWPANTMTLTTRYPEA